MALDIGTIRASLTLNAAEFRNQLQDVSRSMRTAFGRQTQNDIAATGNATNNLNGHLKSVERIVSGILISQGFYQMANQIETAASAMLGFMNNMEKAQIAMEYFVGSAEEASGFIANMKDFAAETAFSTEQALVLSRRLMAAQFQPEKVRSMMEILNDASAASGGTAEQMDRIVLALSQMKTNGKIAGQELRQFAEAGIPIYQILKEELGLTSAELMKIGDMKISGDLGVQAVLSGLEKRYKGAAERIANTVPGMWETIKDNMLMIGAELFAYPYKVMESGIRKLRDGLEDARDLITEGGFGALFEKMFTPQTQEALRAIAAAFRSLGITILWVAKTTGPLLAYMFSKLAQGMAIVVPVVAAIARILAQLYVTALTVIPGIKGLIVTIGGLMIAATAAKVLMMLWRITGLGMIAGVVAIAVRNLAFAITILSKAILKNPIVRGIVIVVAGLVWFISTLELGKKAIASFVQMIQKLAGMAPGDIFQPKETGIVDQMNKYNESALNAGESLKDLAEAEKGAGDAAKKAAKKIKDTFAASFDELYQIPDKLGETEDGLDGLGDIGEGIDLSGMDFSMPEMPDFKWPDKIKMPEIEWPDLPDFGLWIGKFAKPLEKFKWPKWPEWPKLPKFPTLPGPPPSLVTTWEWSMNAIRGFLTGFEFTLKGLLNRLPNMIPNLSPVPLLKPILQGIGNWVNDLGKVFDPLGDMLRNKWGAAWGGLGTAWQTGLAGVIQGVGGFVTNLGNVWNVGWQVIPQVVGQVFENVKGTLTGWVTDGLTTVATFFGGLNAKATQFSTVFGSLLGFVWEGVKLAWDKTMTSIGEGLKTGLQKVSTLWDEHKWTVLGIVGGIVAGVVLWFVGLPAGVIAAIGALVARVGPAVARLGPAVFGAIKGIPNIFKNVMSMLPPEAQDAVNKAGNWFKELPGKVTDFIKSIPERFKSIVEKIVTETALIIAKVMVFFTNLPGNIMVAIAKIPGDTKIMLDKLPVEVTNMLNKVILFFSGLPARVVAAIQAIPNNTRVMLDNLPVSVTQTIEKIRLFFSQLPGKVVAAIQAIPGNTANMLKQIPPHVTNTIENIRSFFSQLPGKVGAAIASIPSNVSGVLNRLPGLAGEVIGRMVSAFAALPGKIVDAISSIPSKIASIFSNIKIPSFTTAASGVKATFSALGNMAGFADGGIIGKDSIVRVGEKGKREAIIPLQNQSAMQPFVDAVVSGMNRGQMSQAPVQQQDTRPTVYVHTLIADKQGLKELHRQLNIVEQSEGKRGVQR